MSKPTSCPWRVRSNDVWPFLMIENEDSTMIARVETAYGIESECEANAKLIAAAPELLLSLSELLDICRWKCSPTDEVLLDNGKTNHQAMIDAMSVIAKAVNLEEAKA